MTEAGAAVDIIIEYCELAIERRRRALPKEAKERAELLDQTLRELIDGARPAPRRIEGHTASAPSGPAKPAAAKAPTQSISDLVDHMELSPKDKAKLKNEIKLEDLAPSAYTRSSTPMYLSDYYSDDIIVSGDIFSPGSTPRGAVIAGGEGVAELSREVRVLFGMEKPEPPKDESRAERIVAHGARARVAASGGGGGAGTGARAAAPAQSSAPQRGRPTIVHLLSGGTKRGQIEMFDPSSGAVEFIADDGSKESAIPLEEVLAIFFGLQRGEEPSPSEGGQRVVVRLVNDRQVVGLTDDYREGGDSLTIAPEQRRGNVDRIWIPAWAVKEIQLG